MELRDSGKIVHLYGILFSNVPDYNGSQVEVDRIEVLKSNDPSKKLEVSI